MAGSQRNAPPSHASAHSSAPAPNPARRAPRALNSLLSRLRIFWYDVYEVDLYNHLILKSCTNMYTIYDTITRTMNLNLQQRIALTTIVCSMDTMITLARRVRSQQLTPITRTLVFHALISLIIAHPRFGLGSCAAKGSAERSKPPASALDPLHHRHGLLLVQSRTHLPASLIVHGCASVDDEVMT